MIPIQSTYTINKNTYALIPAKAIDYDTIVLEKNKVLHIKQTPMTIIETSCCLNWTTYEGRRQAVIHHTNFYQKVPLPISIHKQTYFFPTHSTKHIDNCWLSYPNIQSVYYIKQTPARQPQTILQFKDGQSLKINISKHTIQTQMNRTFQVMYQIETDKKNHVNGLDTNDWNKGSYRTCN